MRVYRGLAIALVLLFLASVARFYRPGAGFTAFIGFMDGHEREVPAMRGVPHADGPAWASYDGRFYAQRALDPFCRDPAVDAAMDLAPFRARRILFSWTAYTIGGGRPAWIIAVFAAQNVVCWLLLAWVLARWLAPTSARGLALWSACLFSHGLLWSVRFALLDGPSLLLIAGAVLAVEAGRPLLSAAVVGIAGLARETNVLALASQPWPRDRRGWVRAGMAAALAVTPLLVWLDYLRSIYRSTIFAGTDTFMLPGRAIGAIWVESLIATRRAGVISPDALMFVLLSSLLVQAAYLVARGEYSSAWWRLAMPYVVLLLVLDSVLADPRTGAITRVMLPMTVAFNVLLAGEARPGRFWAWFVAGNLHLLSVPTVLPLLL